MKDNWVKIFETTEGYVMELKRALLEQSGIPNRIMDHQDSVYTTLNVTRVIELFTLEENAEEARKIIDPESV